VKLVVYSSLTAFEVGD